MTDPVSENYDIYACGGVLSRKGGSGNSQLLYALVHRSRHGDWTIPKGKLEVGEDPLKCALREVLEETGYRCQEGAEITSTSYSVDGRTKLVRYWMMTPVEGNFQPNEEVDSLAWVPLEIALETLTYDNDRIVLAEAASRLKAE